VLKRLHPPIDQTMRWKLDFRIDRSFVVTIWGGGSVGGMFFIHIQRPSDGEKFDDSIRSGVHSLDRLHRSNVRRVNGQH
jgi:hypothetical protein